MKEIRLFLAALNKKGVRLYLEQNKLKSQSPENGISEEERAYIKNNKQTIIQYLESLNKSYSEIQVSSLSKRNLSVGELSFAQRRLWILDCLQGGSSEYNMPMAYNIAGELNLDLVSDVFRTILMRHEILRTVYIENDGEVQQEICHIDRVNFNIRVEDLSDLNGNVLEEQVRTLIEADITSPFNLSEELMLRVSYINKGSGAGILLFNMHHIASDGWSMEVLVKEFFELYYAYSQQKANPLPELELQYMDYACWQREYLEGEVFESQLDYWKQQLNELPAVHSLPLDYARPTVKQHQGAMVAGELSDTIAQRLLLLAKSYQLTPFMLLHGALCMLLSRHSNSQDIVIGTPVANRLQAELEPLIGFFVNTLVLRVDTDHKDLSAYLAHVRQVHLSAQAHQDIPFEQLVEQLKIPRSNAHSPLFQIMMITENDYGLSGGTDKTSFTLPNLDIQRRESDLIQAKFDLNINLSVSDHGVSLQWIYDTSLFTHSHITQLNEHLCCLLEELSRVDVQSAPQSQSLSMLPPDEIFHLVHELNNTEMVYSSDKCIHQLFESQVLEQPEAVALVFGNTQISYGELNERANQLAHYLNSEHKVQSDMLVGLCVERSIEMVIGVLAILKSGGCYVPFDIEHGAEIIHARMDSHKVAVSILSDETEALLQGGTFSSLNINTFFSNQSSQYSTSNLNVAYSPESLAYAMSSSGTTGKPKLIGCPHKALNNLITSITTENEAVKGSHRVLQFSSIGFDMSFTDIGLALLQGGSLYLISENMRFDVDVLIDLIKQHEISLLNLPASMVTLLSGIGAETEQRFPSIRVILSTAEQLDISESLKTFFSLNKNIHLINQFGPTETHVCTTYNLPRSTEDWPSEVPVGKPIGNSHCFVLDNHQSLAPLGAVGELCVSGDCLANGYLGNDALTNKKFIQIDIPTLGPTRLYKTGDLVRWREGELNNEGRADDQVKIHGYRVDLEDVKQQIKMHPEVDNATIVSDPKWGYIIGYYSSDIIDDNQLKAYLLSNMPTYMVPKYLVKVDEFKLTVNGKVDKRSLPTLDTVRQEEFIAPKTEVELRLTEIWADLLGMGNDQISVSSNFFELGGNSIMLVKILHQIQTIFEINLSASDLYQYQNIALLSAFIDEEIALQKLTSLERGESQWEI